MDKSKIKVQMRNLVPAEDSLPSLKKAISCPFMVEEKELFLMPAFLP